MAAPYRVQPPAPPASMPDQVRSYFERVMKMVPLEVVSFYLAGLPFIPEKHVLGHILWAVAGLAGVFVARFFGTRESERGRSTDWVVLVLSMIAFLLWVYNLGGPFKAAGIYIPAVASISVMVWTFFVPFFYKGQAAA